MMGMLAFAAVTTLNLAFSWRWLGTPRSHGFWRFFAFEAICGLVIVQAAAWFKDALSMPQLFSWTALAGSLALAIHGFWLLGQLGKPSGGFESTTVLVVKGAYRYIRHPLYCSLLLLTMGALLKSITVHSAALAVAAGLFLVLTALAEERENLARFGPSYTSYREHTRMFIPWLL